MSQSVTMVAKAETQVGCYAIHDTSTDLKAANKGTVWTKDASVYARADTYNTCLTRVQFRGPTAISIHVNGGALRAKGKAQSNTTRSGGAMESHRISVEMKAATAVQGRLVIRLDGREFTWHQMDGAVASSTVTVGSTRVTLRTPSNPVTKTLTVTIPPSGLVIDVESLGGAQSVIGGATYQLETKIDFFPGDCTASAYGRSCASLAATWPKPRNLQLKVSSGSKNGVGVPIVGVKTLDVALPAPYLGCRLLLEPLFVLPPFTLDGAGSGTHTIVLPAVSGKIFVQDVLVHDLFGRKWFATTNGIDIDCR